MKEQLIKNYLVKECVTLLRREDIRNEVKSFVKPLISLLLDEIYPYIYLCLFLVIISFLLVLGTFILLIKNKTLSFNII